MVGTHGRTTWQDHSVKSISKTRERRVLFRYRCPQGIKKKTQKSEIIKKLGNTYKEANINKAKVEAQVQRSFGVELNELSKVEEVTMMYNRPTTEDLIEAMEIIAK